MWGWTGGYTRIDWKGGDNMCRDELGCITENKNDIYFLFETEEWNGSKIESMTSSHIINTLIMLQRRCNEFKTNYELFVIDNMDNKLLVPKDNIETLAKKDAESWIIETPIYIALMEELEKRGLEKYFDIIMERLLSTQNS